MVEFEDVLTDNIWENDIGYIDRTTKPLSDEDFARIWQDIKLHEDISMENAKREGNIGVCISEWEKIKDAFHERIDDRHFYTDWDASKILGYIASSGVEYPASAAGDIKNKGYSTKGVDIDIDCGDDDIAACTEEVWHIIRCNAEGIDFEGHYPEVRYPKVVHMSCEVDGRQVPTDFILRRGSND